MKPLVVALASLCLVAACSSGGGDAQAQGSGVTAGWNDYMQGNDGGGAAPRPPRGGGRLPPNAIRVQPVTIMDQTGMGKPMPASFGLIPAGWTPRGAGVVWGRQYTCTSGYNIEWAASSPDQAFGIAVMPMIRWETNNYGAGASALGCPKMPFTNLRQMLEWVAGQYKRGAQPLQYRVRHDLAKRFVYLNMRTPSPMGEMAVWVEAGDLLFAFQENGRDMRGVVSTVAVFQAARTSLGYGQDMVALSAASFPGFAATAPEGQLDFQLVAAIAQSFVPNPEWELRIAEHTRALSDVERREAQKRAAIWRETNDYISNLQRDTYAARQRSEDYIARERGKGLRGVEEYADPNAPGGTVELSSYYDHAWALRDGTYVLSTDPNFDPRRDAGLDARKLEPAR